ncbi:MAG: glycine cleavage system aminomethyltransferase GcvT [Gammaproteobacteria bacterium]|jgi:aminomethyltransferase|nr:glycine cleavage system aminomethyltransferase GcvT [Gammaproteobacteria bacterium]
MPKTTSLYEQHLKLGAKIIDFAGWLMPLHYGSQIKEHESVRKDAAVFDVSHMAVIDITGNDALVFLRKVLANDVGKLIPTKALYSCMLNHTAGILDDLIVYCLSDSHYRLVVNAATDEKDLAWLQQQSASYAIKLQPRRDLAILAIQGPCAWEKIRQVFNQAQNEATMELKPFSAIEIQDWLVARTGYTGEDGAEIILPQSQVQVFWENVIANGISPAGLGARDSLRLEAGFNLYGMDMDDSVTPLESNVGWTVDWTDKDREFIGKEALQQQIKSGVKRQLVGVIMLAKAVCRAGMDVYLEDNNHQELQGTLTSGGFSPTLGCSIGLARIPMGDFSSFSIDIRGKRIPVKMIKPPFVKKGIANFSLS